MVPWFLALAPVTLAPPLPTFSRRTAITAAVSSIAMPFVAEADDAACVGFGCDTGSNAQSKSLAPPGSITYPAFLQAIKDKKVEGVIFQPPSGDVAYALIDGKSVRIGEGWPVEMGNSWSSPSWVMRILQEESVPYAWNFDLTAGTKAGAKKVTRAEERYLAAKAAKEAGVSTGQPVSVYVPSGRMGSALSSTNAKTGQLFTAQPKMYGGVDTALDTTNYDWANNGLGNKPP